MFLPDINELQDLLTPLFQAMEWAEEEIEAARRRHRYAADRIWDSFLLLTPTHDLMSRSEAVYRSHCRELLDRVARREDTRSGTAAECCIALCETSLRAPLHTSAAGLYARMWTLAQLPPIEMTDSGVHYEALEGSSIDQQEAWLRQKLRQQSRITATSSAAGAVPREAAAA
ncbi:hypothetical protein [Micromonospora sp. NPDC049107]|uniref:hypothetical protein n=1 Tax=unclassified Micromonospora TaxID=2617518 RepID=UPI0033CE5764